MTRIALFAMPILFLFADSARAGVYFGSFHEDFPPFTIAHAPGYAGGGGSYTLTVCAGPTASNTIPATLEAIALWNALTPTTENCNGCLTWEEADQKPGKLPRPMLLTLTHELGHCAMGLDHTNWEDGNMDGTSFTATKAALTMNDGADNIRGSSDDTPSPLPGSLVLHWFRKADNDPFVSDATVIDSATYTRRIIDLPSGHTWQANGNRGVALLLGHLKTQSVMYSALTPGSTFSGLTADEVNTVAYARTGLDSLAGTADDYSVDLEFSHACANAEIEVVWTDDVLDDAPAECVASLIPIDTPGIDVHFGLVPPDGAERLVVKVNSTKLWDVVFVDGFESGSLSRWSVAAP